MARNKAIQDAVLKDRNEDRKVCKLLFLGSGESGKSTFFRQMQICHGRGFMEADLMKFTPIVYSNTTGCMRTLIEQSQVLPGCAYSRDVHHFASLIQNLPEDAEISPEIAQAVEYLWADPGIKATWQKRALFQVFDSAEYFFENVHNFESPSYVASVDDMLRCRARTSGIVEETFKFDDVFFQVFDVGGQRNERKKWIHCFENVTAVAFVTSISEFDQVLVEDGKTNRLAESLAVFTEVVENRWFQKTSIILFLNKKDLLYNKLQSTRFRDYYPAYAQDNSYEAVSKFIRGLFLERAPHRQNDNTLYTHFTCATDETPQLRKLFQSVKNIVVEASLREGGFV